MGKNDIERLRKVREANRSSNNNGNGNGVDAKKNAILNILLLREKISREDADELRGQQGKNLLEYLVSSKKVRKKDVEMAETIYDRMRDTARQYISGTDLIPRYGSATLNTFEKKAVELVLSEDEKNKRNYGMIAIRAGLAALVLAASGFISYKVFSPKEIATATLEEQIYAGIDTNDFASNKNRQAHAKNLSGLYWNIKQFESEGNLESAAALTEQAKKYINEIQQKDPNFSKENPGVYSLVDEQAKKIERLKFDTATTPAGVEGEK